MALGLTFIAIGILVGSLLAMSQMIGSKKEGSQVDPSSSESEGSESENSTPAPSPEPQPKSSRWWKFSTIVLVIVVICLVWQIPNFSSIRIKSDGWNLIGNFPVHISGNSFNAKAGKNGERVGTGDFFIIELPPGKYRFSPFGVYQKRFFKYGKWRGKNIPYDGIEMEDFANRPFLKFRYGTLLLRLNNREGVLPFGTYTFDETTRVYAELNINRDPMEYRDSKGTTLNDGLSIIIEKAI